MDHQKLVELTDAIVECGLRRRRFGSGKVQVLCGLMGLGGAAALHADPQGMTVGQGSAVVSGVPGNLTIQTGDRTVLNWTSFNIGLNESLTFVQPTAASVVWNHIADSNPSQIHGRISANGIVVLQNASGFYFGPNSFVQAMGLVVTTSPGMPPDFAGGGAWQFSGPPPVAPIVNHGSIVTEKGGSVFLISERVDNHGNIDAPGGNVRVYGGEKVLVSERPDGRGISAEVSAPGGVINNAGRITADAGSIALHAKVVNQSGHLQANTVREQGGVIELLASEEVNLAATSHMEARGGDGAVSDGGKVVIRSRNAFRDQDGSAIDIRGGGQGGKGGFAEISALDMRAIRSDIDGRSAKGFAGGELLIDPTDILIGSGGIQDTPSLLQLDVNSSFRGLSQIRLEATRDITIASGTVWDLDSSTGVNAGEASVGSLLSLVAGRDIVFQSGSALLAGRNWTVELKAGANLANPVAIVSGIGSILLQGTSFVEGLNGGLSLAAGKDVIVQAGAVRTVGGGSIDVLAVAGSINTGTRAEGYRFTANGSGYVVSTTLGGISTAAGGDVTLKAGLDVISLFPSGTSNSHSDAGSGAFGSEAGDVKIEAGRDVTGHFVAANGNGVVKAGRNAGSSNRQLALSLVKGGWTVDAGNDILLQEVRNPNGIFNNRGFGNAPLKHHFDYDPAAFVNLVAVHSIELLGAALPRLQNELLPSIYPPSLTIRSGAGGVILGNDIILYPSAQGQLEMVTTAGGSLQSSQSGKPRAITMSDSTRTRFSDPLDYGPNDLERGMIHQSDLVAAHIEIGGTVSDIQVWLPKRAVMTVGGDLVNSSLVTQHYRVTDVTTLAVEGDIKNRNDWTFFILEQAPDLDSLFNALEPQSTLFSLQLLRNKMVYTEGSRRLAFQGRMTAEELNYLNSLQFKTFGVDGRPILDEFGNFVTVPGSLLPSSVVQDIYQRSQDIPDQRSQGYQVGGPGKIEVRARNLDLGITEGIVSLGAGANSLLAGLADGYRGADIDVAIRGDLSMFSSSIQTRAGGNVKVRADGVIDVGSQEVLASSEIARGIYAAREGNVEVVAKGDIRINGSRIAAYSGGTVRVKSEEGNVDAGEGGVGFVRVQRILTKPGQNTVEIETRGIPGSGILAVAFPGTDNNTGDIFVETPKGDIRAGLGGIAQIAFNGRPNTTGVVDLKAGTEGDTKGGNIFAGKSGVIGGNVKLKASKSIEGVVIAQNNIQIDAIQNVNVTALASGNVSIAAAGTVSGTVIGGGSIDAQGGKVDAAMFATSVSGTGGAQATQANVSSPSTTSQAAAATTSNEDNSKPADEADPKKDEKKRNSIASLVKTQGRVTVLLPSR